VEVTSSNGVCVTLEQYNKLVDARALLLELREALVTQDFMHWRKSGKQAWVARIDALNV
jgi:hypothetical protein